MSHAAEQLIGCYASLAERGAHLLGDLVGRTQPRQWRHYPEDDVVDHVRGYQYFYHSHSAADREASDEHGHFHLFARMDRDAHRIDERAELGFLQKLRAQPAMAGTASLLCISLDAKGVPASLFTVNRWVTGDHLYSAATTLRLLANFKLEPGGPALVNRWLAAMVQLFWPDIEALMARRDLALLRHAKRRQRDGILDDEHVEILSGQPIDIDRRIALLDR